MKNKKRLANYIFSVLSILASIYCLLAYRYLQPLLTTDLGKQTSAMERVELLIILALVIIGLYHINLLVNSLKTLPKQKGKIFLHSLYIVFVVLSGILIVSDAVILYDIGKEYQVWDMTGQWELLYILTIIHAAVTVVGFIYTGRFHETGGVKELLKEIRQGNDVLFLSLNQVAFICGVLGLVAAVGARNDMFIYYRASITLTLSVLVMLPIVLFTAYWMLKNRRKNIRLWIDEKQVYDTYFGALVTVVTGTAALCAGFFLSLFGIVASYDLSALVILFFLQLAVFSGVVTIKSGGACE